MRELVAASARTVVQLRPEQPATPVVGAAPPAATPASVPADEYERLGVQPTPDDGTRLSATAPWNERRARAARAPAPSRPTASAARSWAAT